VVTSTILVTVFAPLFYVIIYKALGKHRKRERAKAVQRGTAS
jgi:HAE1 family hydrophobic/amphiphilic exporter-1